RVAPLAAEAVLFQPLVVVREWVHGVGFQVDRACGALDMCDLRKRGCHLDERERAVGTGMSPDHVGGDEELHPAEPCPARSVISFMRRRPPASAVGSAAPLPWRIR